MNDVLEQLKQEMQECKACNLCLQRKNVVFGQGNINAPSIMIVGEAPGEEEDETGVPFIGRCGKKLDEILTFAGINRNEIYITNSNLCRPPNNRTPTFQEILACRWRLLVQIDQIKPKIIVTMGRVAAQSLLGKELTGPLNKLFNTRFHNVSLKEHKTKVVFSYHPSYLLRNRKVAFPIMMRHWKDIKNELQNYRKT